jgi:hypothetical protein
LTRPDRLADQGQFTNQEGASFVKSRHFSRRVASALSLAPTLGATSALAHHGWSGYLDDDFTLTGVVEEIDLGQPHGHLTVRANGEV